MKTLIRVLLVFIFASPALAQPDYVNYQGLLKDAEGEPLTTGSYQMQFSIYDQAMEGGTVIWGPFFYDSGDGDGHAKEVVVSNGRFNVILGPKDTTGRYLSDSFGGDLAFVEISVAGGNPILPRQQILSTPYALESANARSLGGMQPVEFRNPPGIIVPFAGPVENVPVGWALCDGTEFNVTEQEGLYAVIGKNWGGRQEVAGEVTVDYFNLPDLRGVFLRGANNGRSDGFEDPDAASRTSAIAGGNTGDQEGSFQSDAAGPHVHQWSFVPSGAGITSDLHTWDVSGETNTVMIYSGRSQIANTSNSGAEDNHHDSRDGFNAYTNPETTVQVDQAGETRPNNAAVHYIIKL